MIAHAASKNRKKMGVEVQTPRLWEKSGELVPDRCSTGGAAAGPDAQRPAPALRPRTDLRALRDPKHGIVIINQDEPPSFEEELVRGVIEIITVFSPRLYGSRSHKTKRFLARHVAQTSASA
jgi:hypothetical protein